MKTNWKMRKEIISSVLGWSGSVSWVVAAFADVVAGNHKLDMRTSDAGILTHQYGRKRGAVSQLQPINTN